jgi:hypothetical protein
MFPESDQSINDAARFFYGSDKKGFVLTEEEVPLNLLTSVIDSDKLNDNARMRRIGSNDSYHDTGVENEVDPIIYINKSNVKNHEWALEEKEEYRQELKAQMNSKEIDWDKLASRVHIFRDFLYREERLKYAALLGLAQNMVWMKGGASLYRVRLEEFNENHEGNNPYPRDGRFELCRRFHKRNKDARTCYFPMRLENFSPYEVDGKYRNLLDAERDFARGVQVLEPINKATLLNAEQMLQYKLNEARDDLDDTVWLFKLPTGLGKTYHIKDEEYSVLAFPNHQLKDEVLYEKRSNPHNAIATPEVPTFQSEELNARISNLYELGLSKLAYRKILEVSHQVTNSNYSTWDINKADQYIRQLKECFATQDKTVFTTHSRAIFSENLPHDTIIFDEDPLEELIRVQYIDLEDLQKLSWSGGRKLFEHSEDSIWDLFKFLVEDVEEGEITELPHNFNIDLEERTNAMIQQEGISSNLVDFLRCNFIYKEEGNEQKIFFVNQNFLPQDKKCIIMSATLNLDIYKKLLGQRAKIVDISDVEQKGTVIQHTKKSYSRSSLEGTVDELNEKLADKPTLTFMTYTDQVKNGVKEIYYGKSEGFDFLKGKDLNVVGTPFKNQALYLLMGKCLGINVDRFNREFKYQNVEWNGFRFAFNTFSNKDLREIHLADLEADLIQIIGRARCLREDVQVDVYSSLPLRLTDKFIHD